MDYHKELSKVIEAHPSLVFDNDGYEQLPREVIEANIEGFKRVEELLKEAVAGFVRFQNFKPRKDGSIEVRCQTKWSEGFIGVSYFPLENFKPGHKSWSEA